MYHWMLIPTFVFDEMHSSEYCEPNNSLNKVTQKCPRGLCLLQDMPAQVLFVLDTLIPSRLVKEESEFRETELCQCWNHICDKCEIIATVFSFPWKHHASYLTYTLENVGGKESLQNYETHQWNQITKIILIIFNTRDQLQAQCYSNRAHYI